MKQFIESIKRLYIANMVTEEKIIELYKSGKITENEKNYILEVNQAL
jgi:hypothetical protein